MPYQPHPEEPQLIRQAVQGSLDAQQALYRQHAKAVLNTCYRILHQRQDAEDAMQETFVKVFRNLSGFKATAPLCAWIRRIAANTAINALKQRSRLDFQDLREDLHAVADEPEPERDITAEQALAALLELPDGYRTVVTLYLIEGYAHKEIAEILNISLATSLTQYQRGKARLRAILQKQLRHENV